MSCELTLEQLESMSDNFLRLFMNRYLNSPDSEQLDIKWKSICQDIVKKSFYTRKQRDVLINTLIYNCNFVESPYYYEKKRKRNKNNQVNGHYHKEMGDYFDYY